MLLIVLFGMIKKPYGELYINNILYSYKGEKCLKKYQYSNKGRNDFNSCTMF